MATNVIMPALEMAQETGKVVQWLKRPGDTVQKGEPLVEIETDKVTVEIEAPASGVLRSAARAPGARGWRWTSPLRPAPLRPRLRRLAWGHPPSAPSGGSWPSA